ncbi:MAG: NAD(P)H-hydrate epimerase, partial [Candidatus Desantisbacteria bacterium]
MKVATPDQMHQIDKKAFSDFGIEPLILMENAGITATSICLAEIERISGRSVTVFCGPGNNGGDGFVVARHLFLAGISVKCFVVSAEKQSQERQINYKIVEKLGIPIITNLSQATADLFVDGLLGTGISKPPSDEIAACIDFMNNQEGPVVSLDIPSGLCGERGIPLGATVKADITVTFGLPKLG